VWIRIFAPAVIVSEIAWNVSVLTIFIVTIFHIGSCDARAVLESRMLLIALHVWILASSQLATQQTGTAKSLELVTAHDHLGFAFFLTEHETVQNGSRWR
jgi:hypothetical protein